jgi:hypothetical protein
MSVPLKKVQVVRDKLAALQSKVSSQKAAPYKPPAQLAQKSSQSVASTSNRKTAMEEIDDSRSYSVTTFSKITSSMVLFQTK